MERVQAIHHKTFRSGSRTYFNSSRFFPPTVRQDVYILYGFVRTADDFVDILPADAEGLVRFEARFRAALEGRPAADEIIDSFVDLSRRRSFNLEWTNAFLEAMRMDIGPLHHATLESSLRYMYGSAEVIGLFMARIMKLPPEADEPARLLGRAMQYINFIRDIDEDNGLGRIYLPIEESTLSSLSQDEAEDQPEEFVRFVRAQLERFHAWQAAAEDGYRFIPRRYRIPIKTAADMYKWTADEIEQDPFVVYRKKVKPSQRRVVGCGFRNAVVC